MKKTENTIWVLAAAFWLVCIIVAAAGYFFIIQPQQISLSESQYKMQQSLQRMEEAQMASVTSVQHRQSDQIEHLKQQSSRFLVSKIQRDQLLYEISQIANTLQLEDYSGKLSADPWSPQEDRLSRIWMEIRFESSFEQYGKFLTELERHSPVVFIASTSIQRSPDDARANRIQLFISFLVEQVLEDTETTAAVVQKGQDVL